MNIASRLTAGFTLAASCTLALAQTTPITPASPASRPDAVAVSPETAREANDKAIQRSDTATVVKTGPTVADKARQAEAKMDGAMDRTADRMTDRTTDRTTTTADGSVTPGTRSTGMTGTTMASNTTGSGMRAPRADRN